MVAGSFASVRVRSGPWGSAEPAGRVRELTDGADRARLPSSTSTTGAATRRCQARRAGHAGRFPTSRLGETVMAAAEELGAEFGTVPRTVRARPVARGKFVHRGDE